MNGLNDAAMIELPFDEIDLYRIIKRSGARKHADIARAIVAGLTGRRSVEQVVAALREGPRYCTDREFRDLASEAAEMLSKLGGLE